MAAQAKGQNLIHLAVLLFYTVLAATIAVSQAKAADRLNISATLSSDTIALDETAVLTITISGTRSADITLPEVEHLLFQQSGRSVRTSVINGSSSSSITSTYILQPQQEGTYTIPPCTAQVDGEILTTNSLSFTVTPARRPGGSSAVADSDTPQGEAEGLAFLTVSGLKNKVYTGEVIPVEIKAYFRRGIRVEIPRLPEVKGDAFVLSPPVDTPQQMVESHEGEEYSTISWKSAVAAVKEGQHELRIQLDATLLVPQRTTGTMGGRHPLFSDNFFNDDFFDGFLNTITRKEVSLFSPKHSSAVQPLPVPGKPDHFNGAVGSFNFSTTTDRQEIEVGEPITLIMTITGTGNFDRVSAPPFPEGHQWKTYKPTSSLSEGPGDHERKKVFEQAIVAQNSHVTQIPPLSFSYFDPDREEYITRTSKPLPLTVNESENDQQQTQPQPAAQNDRQTAAQHSEDLLALHTRLQMGKPTGGISPVFLQSWYIAAFLICTVLLAGALCLVLRRRHRHRHSEEIRQHAISRDIAGKLHVLQQTISAGNIEEFLRGCRTIIQMRLALLWQKEPSAITLLDLQSRLESDSPLIHIFSTAEKFHYGGQPPTIEEMKTYHDILEKELEVPR
jgi:hypothetical protein